MLIRELALRRGMGWRGRLLLAAAFGLAMTSVIDLSLWTVHRDEIDYWDQIQLTTRLDSLGFAVYPVVVWVLGHVVLSISAPTAIVEALAGDLRDEPWLRVPGLVVWTVLFLAVAAAIHASEGSEYDVHPSAAQYAGAVVAIVLLVAAALSRWGRPLERRERSAPGVLAALLVGIVLLACLDFIPISWAGVVVAVVGCTVVAALLLRWGRSPAWTGRQASALAVGAVALRTSTSFLSPVPEGADPVAKVLQSVVVVLLVGGLCWWLWRASWSRRPIGTGRMTP